MTKAEICNKKYCNVRIYYCKATKCYEIINLLLTISNCVLIIEYTPNINKNNNGGTDLWQEFIISARDRL